MPDVPVIPEPEEADPSRIGAAIWGAGGYVDAQVRRAATGDTEGKVRRPLLFVIVGLAVLSSGIPILAGLGMTALVFLALTDQVSA